MLKSKPHLGENTFRERHIDTSTSRVNLRRLKSLLLIWLMTV